MAKAKIKVVMAIYSLNFCDQIEFEGSKPGAADIKQVGRGQAFQLGIQVGSTFNEETGEWGNLIQEWVNPEEPQSGFSAPFGQAPADQVPTEPVPVDPQVVAAQKAAEEKLEADRLAAEAKAKADAEKKEFVMP